MLISSIPIFLALLELLPSSVRAANGSCQHISSITDTDAILYLIPRANPPTTLSFTSLRIAPMNPTIALLAIIENMQPICRHFTAPFPPSWVFEYALVRVSIQDLFLSCGPLTYNDACTALRGLAEFMVFHKQLRQWSFQIWVNQYAVGGGEIANVLPIPGVATS